MTRKQAIPVFPKKPTSFPVIINYKPKPLFLGVTQQAFL